MANECSSAQSCKDAALDRFKDAFALYEKERYTAVLYMSGYVIELGVKSEFHRLANVVITKEHAKDIIKYLFEFENVYPNSNQKRPEWIDNFVLPSTLFEWVNFIENIADEDKRKNEKLLANKIENSNTFSVILFNRLKPSKEANSKFHDISGFLDALHKWKEKMGEETFLVDDYKIDGNLGWSTNLRYMKSDKETEEKAKQVLLTSIKFLSEILQVDVSRYEDKLNPSNKQRPIDIEKRY